MSNQSHVISNADKSERHAGLGLVCGFALIIAAVLIAMQPTISAMHAKAQALVVEEVARENTTFCEKRGFTAGAREHEDCVRDLNDLRAKQDKRTAESAYGIL